MEKAGYWWIRLTEAERNNYPVYLENQEAIHENWHKDFGDRLNELVFIGQDLNKEEIEAELNYCLCTLEEVRDFLNGAKFNDPLPKWQEYA